VKVDRSRIEEALRGADRDDAAREARRSLPEQVDTDEHHDQLRALGLDVDHLLGPSGRRGAQVCLGCTGRVVDRCLGRAAGGYWPRRDPNGRNADHHPGRVGADR